MYARSPWMRTDSYGSRTLGGATSGAGRSSPISARRAAIRPIPRASRRRRPRADHRARPPAPARRARALQPRVIGVDRQTGIVARRLGAAPLGRVAALRLRREARDLDPHLAAVARGQLRVLGVAALAG